MSQKFIVTIGHVRLAFDNAETAMRAYALLSESTPCTSPYIPYGNSEYKKPDSLEKIEYVREADSIEIELKRVDATKFALHLTEDEFREKCRVQPTEVEGDARLVEPEVVLVALIERPDADTSADETQPEPFI